MRLQAVHTVHEVAAQHMDLTPTQVGSHKTIVLLLCVGIRVGRLGHCGLGCFCINSHADSCVWAITHWCPL